MIVDGFDLDSPLVCEGIIGDGCGGGRIFYIEDEILFAYDPISKESITLLKELKDAVDISKAACIISINCLEGSRKLDLSTL